MEFKISETSRGKKSLVYDGFSFRFERAMKNGDISWRCTVKSCNSRVITDEGCKTLLSGRTEHNHDTSERKIQRQIIRAVVKRKAASEITSRPMKLIRCELQNMDDDRLTTKDLKSLTMSIYRQRRKEYPTLPKSRDEV